MAASQFPITHEDYLKKRDNLAPLTDEMHENMERIISAANLLLLEYGGVFYGVSSGYRPPTVNAAAHGANKSPHLTCEAVDLRDPDGRLAKWCESHLEVLSSLGLYLESPRHTPSWVHVQTRAPKSGRRVFIP